MFCGFVFRGFAPTAIINVPGVFVVSDNTPGYFMSPRRGYDEKNIFVFLDRGFAPTAIINRRAAACIAVDGIFNLYK